MKASRGAAAGRRWRPCGSHKALFSVKMLDQHRVEGDEVSGQQGSREAHGLAVEVEREEEGWTVTLPRKHEGPGQEQNARAEAPLGSTGGVSRLML